ncbi:Cyclin-dependent kinase inhibitor 3-like protein [Drosera capensis]
MGKYMKKSKPNVMEVNHGVCTRAKTLAMQLQPESELSYLQLRSRRLEKPQFPPPAPRQQRTEKGSTQLSRKESERKDVGCFGHFGEGAEEGGVEGSCGGENNLDFDGVERSTRESTPCSFIRDMDAATTPGSAVRPSCSAAASRRARNVTQRIIPTTFEMEAFFADAELQQQKLFMEKYNFDIASDSPLPGRYEWVQIDP